MDKIELGKDYEQNKEHYKILQNEAFDLASALEQKHRALIHIESINQRPDKDIKPIESITKNIDSTNKYLGYNVLFDIKDIAGIRVTCHTEEDVDNFARILNEVLTDKYKNVNREDKDFPIPYRAIHFTFSKSVSSLSIFCEIQIRTVMAHAWAVQSHKYLYKKNTEGEAQELTNAVSEIMKGCEKLWSLVKRKSQSEDTKITQTIKDKITKKEWMVLPRPSRYQNKELDRWLNTNINTAVSGLDRIKINASMEVMARVLNSRLNIASSQLQDNSRDSEIHTFGWPIAVSLDNREEFRPRPDACGIHAEVSIERALSGETTYDYWAINKNGAFYLLKSIFEDMRKPGHIFFDTRIIRITETFMYLRNLYSKFNLDIDADLEITIKHSGLKDRVLSSASPHRMLFDQYKSYTNEVVTTISTTLRGMNKDTIIVDLVEAITKPLFEQFDFFKPERRILEEIVTNYLKGKVV